MDWIYLAQDKAQWRRVVNTFKVGNILLDGALISPERLCLKNLFYPYSLYAGFKVT